MINQNNSAQEYWQTEYQPACDAHMMPCRDLNTDTVPSTPSMPSVRSGMSTQSMGNNNNYYNPGTREMMPNMISPSNDMMNTSLEPGMVANPEYIPAFLKNYIGSWARIDFLIGNNIEQRVGQILEVGTSYLVLRALEPETIIMCDLFSVKFAAIIIDDNMMRPYII